MTTPHQPQQSMYPCIEGILLSLIRQKKHMWPKRQHHHQMKCAENLFLNLLKCTKLNPLKFKFVVFVQKFLLQK